MATVTTKEYGFEQGSRVNLQGRGTEATFTATAQHMDSTKQFMWSVDRQTIEMK